MDNLLATDSSLCGKGEKLELAQATTELALVERWDGGCELLPSGALDKNQYKEANMLTNSRYNAEFKKAHR